MTKFVYKIVVVLVLVGMLTSGATAATAKSDVFVGSTDLSKTLYKELNDSSTMFRVDSVPDNDTLTDAMLEALAQNPYVAHITMWNTRFYAPLGYIEITPNYVLKADTRKKQKTALPKKVNAVVAKIITDGMTTEQKVDAIQRYIAANCEYDYDTLKLIVDNKDTVSNSPDSFTAYGALVNGKAVCQGYTKAFKALADVAGVRNVVIFGVTNNGIPHSWSRVYDNGSWNTVDTSNLDLNMWQQTGAYVDASTVKARLVPNKQTIVDSQWKSLFGTNQ